MPIKKLIIVGAGGFGREVLSWIKKCSEYRKSWDVAGFLDDGEKLVPNTSGLPILGKISDHQPAQDECFICSITEPKAKRRCTEMLLKKGADFINIIHPTVVLGDRVQLGTGIIICPYTVMTCDISVADFCSFNLFCAIGHDVSIGSYCHFNSYSELTGGVTIADEVYMATHASVLQNLTVGEGAKIGAGSVAMHNIKAGQTVFGNPAKPIWLKD